MSAPARPKLKLANVSRLVKASCVFAAAFAIGRCVSGPTYGRDVGDLAAALGEAAGGVVEPKDVRWEPSEGAVNDFVLGRWALFLAANQKGGPRDVWRARVRLTPEGRPLAVSDAHDLTGTPLGDDHALVIRGSSAAFATYAYGQEQSVSLLDLATEGAQNKTTSLADRAMAWVTNAQQTGAGAGVARVDVTLEEPAKAVGLALGEDALAIDLADDSGKIRHASLDVARGELAPGAEGMHAEASRHLAKRFVFWAVDTVRAVPWIGPEPIAWLEDHVFALRDEVHQLAFKIRGGDDSATDTLAKSAEPAAAVLDSSQAAVDSGHWPPQNIASLWQKTEPGEGVWVAPKMPWLKRIPTADATTPPAMLRTFVRPDPDRPYSQVLLVAMDTRQLDLDMEAGVEDPKPLTGPHGAGHLPRDPRVFTRVVAAFNGAFKTEHGFYGMMVKKRVLLPPQPAAASVVVLADGRAGFGTWGQTDNVTGISGVADDDIVSFRQNLDPLLDHGELNPTKRSMWGYTLPGNGAQTERTGICVTKAGHLVYAWGEEVSGTTLGKAMQMAGCDYAIHLDMNPHHTGFTFANIDDIKTRKYKVELLSSEMEISPDRYVEYAPKDFFYVMLRDPTPPAIDRASAWKADGGTQPAPAWMPAVWETTLGGSAGVSLVDVEAGRATWRIRAGAKEPDAKTGSSPSTELSGEDAHRVIVAIGLGASTEKHPAGLATDGKMVLEMGAGAESGAIVTKADGSIAIVHASEIGTVGAHTDAVEAPLVLDAGALTAGANVPRDSADRAALGITATGRVILARGVVATDAPLAQALKDAGCMRAVALDRGAKTLPFVHRAGTPDPPRAHYEQSVLFAMATPMMPRAFRFDATAAVSGPAKSTAAK